MFIADGSLTRYKTGFAVSVLDIVSDVSAVLAIGLCHRYHPTDTLPGALQGSVGWQMVGSHWYVKLYCWCHIVCKSQWAEMVMCVEVFCSIHMDPKSPSKVGVTVDKGDVISCSLGIDLNLEKEGEVPVFFFKNGKKVSQCWEYV